MFPLIQWFALAYSVLNIVHMEELPTNCGKQVTDSPTYRIKGGLDAVPGEWPWQVQIFFNQPAGDGYVLKSRCGGTIIATQWILTAAHCVEDATNSQIEIHYNTIYDSFNNKSGKEATVNRYWMGPYNDTTHQFDWALIKINEKINFTGNVRPICLANHTIFSRISKNGCISTGWGITNPDVDPYRLGESLKMVKENIVSDDVCEAMYPGQYNEDDLQQNLCTRGVKNETGTCTGDSGGPLQCKYSDGKFYQVGITSYGQTLCPEKNWEASGFAKVPYFLDEFKRIMNEN